MADDSDKREYRAKIEDPGKKITTRKDAATAKQDMEFGEAMEADMKRYRRSMSGGAAVDEDWKNRPRFDGNKNLEAGQDLTFTDKMYTPVVKMPENAERGDTDTKSSEAGEDNAYFWNSNDAGSIRQNRRNIKNSTGRKGPDNK